MKKIKKLKKKKKKMLIILFILLILFILFILFIAQKKRKEIISFLNTYKFTIFSVLFTIGCVSLLALKKINFFNVEADQKLYEKVKKERLIQIRNYIIQTSGQFNSTGHDFCLTKTKALYVILDYQLSCLDDFEIQYIAITGPNAIRNRFDANISTILADTGEFGCAIQQCCLIIEDVFKELSNTPGLAERKLRQIEQMRFQEGEVIYRKLIDEVFDNQAKFISNEQLNAAIFEECATVVRKQFCLKYAEKHLVEEDYQFYHDPNFRKEIANVSKKFLIENQEFK